MHEPGLLEQAFVYLLAGVVAVPLARRLGLGPILGYLIAGIVIGPSALGLIGDHPEGVMALAEFGIVMMLFIIGLELRPELLWQLRGSILGLGGLQIILTAAAITGIGLVFGLAWPQALAIGLIFAGSSTAIAVQSLQETGLMSTPAGRSGFAMLLFQDITVIPILAALPLMAMESTLGTADGTAPGGVGSILVVVAAVAVVAGGRFVITPVFRAIAAARIPEIFTAAALLIVVGVTLAMEAAGLSPALGAFLAGVVLASSEYRHELESDIEPFKGLLLGLFFISIGATIDFGLVLDRPGLIIALVALLVLVKGGIVFALARAWGHRKRRSLSLAIILAQGGEFAFVLLAHAVDEQVLPPQLADLLVAVTALSMAVTPLLLILDQRLLQPAFGAGDTRKAERASDVEDTGATAIIAGFGRFGQIAGRLLMANGFRPVLLDDDPAHVELLRGFGFRVFYGDATRLDLLRAAGADRAELLIIALDNREKILELAETAQKHFPHMAVIARARDRRHAYELMRRGVEYLSRETFGSALDTGREALKLLGFRAYQARRAAMRFAAHDEREMSELYKLWGDQQRYRVRARRGTEDLFEVLSGDRADFAGVEDGAWETPPRDAET
jgi:monovalent cation:proton antiporter-2 (CPA2) family protein